jgi:hypothetical protein
MGFIAPPHGMIPYALKPGKLALPGLKATRGRLWFHFLGIEAQTIDSRDPADLCFAPLVIELAEPAVAVGDHAILNLCGLAMEDRPCDADDKNDERGAGPHRI